MKQIPRQLFIIVVLVGLLTATCTTSPVNSNRFPTISIPTGLPSLIPSLPSVVLGECGGWTLEADIPMSSSQVQDMGGVAQGVNVIQDGILAAVLGNPVEIHVTSQSS